MTVYAVYLHPKSTTIPNKAIEFVLGDDDWIRVFDGRTYVIASSDDVEKLFARLRSVVDDDISYIVVELREEAGLAASVPAEFWEWLEKYFPRLQTLQQYEASKLLNVR